MPQDASSFVARFFVVDLPMILDAFRDLRSNTHDWIKMTRGILKNHSNFDPPHLSEFLVVKQH
jgi:hypothetical protein